MRGTKGPRAFRAHIKTNMNYVLGRIESFSAIYTFVCVCVHYLISHQVNYIADEWFFFISCADRSYMEKSITVLGHPDDATRTRICLKENSKISINARLSL